VNRAAVQNDIVNPFLQENYYLFIYVSNLLRVKLIIPNFHQIEDFPQRGYLKILRPYWLHQHLAYRLNQ
jgi:hypothetical protein